MLAGAGRPSAHHEMSSAGDADTGRPRAADLFENEAEHSGDEGSGDEVEAEGDGGDVPGLISNEAEVDAAPAEGGDASSSEAEGLDEGDLNVLEGFGVDVEQVRTLKRPQEEGAAADADQEAGKSSSKRPRLASTSEPAEDRELFGDDDDLNKGAPAPAAQAADDDLWDESDIDDLDDVVVQDSRLKRRRAEEAEGHNITEEQLQEIIDIFGDTSVLRPVDDQQMEAVDEIELMAQASSAAATPSDAASASLVLPLQSGSQSGTPGSIAGPLTPIAAGDTAASAEAAERAAASAMERELFGDDDEASGSAMTPLETPGATPGSAKGIMTPGSSKGVMTPPARGTMTPKQEPAKQDSFNIEALVARHAAPERWLDAYFKEPSLLDAEGNRKWTAEEHECEANYIYFEHFYGEHSQPEKTLPAILKVLDMLHEQRLDPIYIDKQCMWQFQQLLYQEGLLKIFELDARWQSTWARYVQLSFWVTRLKEHDVAIPAHVAQKLQPKLFEASGADKELSDLYDWFNMVHYEHVAKAPKATSIVVKDTMAEIMDALRKHNFDQLLGIAPGGTKTLEAFGITPDNLGDNLEQKKQTHEPKDYENEEHTPENLCSRVAVPDTPLGTAAMVIEAVTVFLSRHIAAEPRVRRFVRNQFMNLCTVSTSPTQLGKKAAYDASIGLREEYRAFHLVNRPVSKFGQEIDGKKQDDTLFLEVLDLQRKGLINMEYSLCVQNTKSQTSENAYMLVMLGHDEEQVSRDKQRLTEHSNKWLQTGNIPADEDMLKYLHCNQVNERLIAIARSHEVMTRIKSGGEHKAVHLYNCANMKFKQTTLNNFMCPDPILEGLQKKYCKVEKHGEQEDQVFIVPSAWNNIRKQIILRALRDELYPMLWAEVQQKLARDAEDVVCRLCGEELKRKIDIQPYRLNAKEYGNWKSNRKYAISNVKDIGNMADDSDSDDDREWQREKSARFDGYGPVLCLVPEIAGESCVAALVNEHGDPVDVRILLKSFHQGSFMRKTINGPQPLEPGTTQYFTQEKREEHKQQLIGLIKRYQPAMILLPVLDEGCQNMHRFLEELLETKDLILELSVKPIVEYGDATLPRAVAYLPRLREEGVYRDCELTQQRIAISSARFMQDPIAEACQLWDERPEENGLLTLHLHRLQQVVQQDRILQTFRYALMEVVAKAGVNVNRIRRSAHIGSVLPFAPGLGPKRAPMFRNCLNDVVTNRENLAKRLTRQCGDGEDGIVRNCIPFMKICPLPGDDSWEADQMPGLDRTRLESGMRPWLHVLCREALRQVDGGAPAENAAGSSDEDSDENSLFEGDDSGTRPKKKKKSREPDDHDCIAEVMMRLKREMKREGDRGPLLGLLHAVPLDIWQDKVGIQAGEEASLDTLLSTILIPELTEPFKDQRRDFEKQDESTVFYLMIKSSPANFGVGTMVNAVVQKDREFDAGGGQDEEKKVFKDVQCNIVPFMVKGSFKKMYPAGSGGGGYVPGCDREFLKGQAVTCRVVAIKPGRMGVMISLSVDPAEDLWKERFPLYEEDLSFFVPDKVEDWTKATMGIVDVEKDDSLVKKKAWVQRPRNIRHPNFLNKDHQSVLEILNAYPLGNVLFRPSKRFDTLLAYLKVFETSGDMGMKVENCFRVFDVREVREIVTEASAFEVAKDLHVEGQVYRSFDEIIAGHMDPIMENLRLLQEHPRFGVREGYAKNHFMVREALKEFTKNDTRTLQYAFAFSDKSVGHGLLIWALGGRPPKEELIEVTPVGFNIWGRPFEQLRDLIQWFKQMGWRQASRARKEWVAACQKQREAKKDARGTDVLEEERAKRKADGKFSGFGSVASGGLSGLQTPGGHSAAGTPTAYQAESAAPTPAGLRTPTFATGFATPTGLATPRQSGFRTPTGLATPRQAGLGMQTPRISPATPKAAVGVPSTPRFVPQTPSGALPGGGVKAPTTPASLLQPQQQRTIPRTPVGLLGGQQTFSMAAAAGTPAGPPPGTPMPGMMGRMAAGTPAGPPPGSPSRFVGSGMRAAGTPAGPPPASQTPGMFRSASATPAGPPPASPAGGVARIRAAGTPGSNYMPPATPSPGAFGFRGAGSPGVPAAMTPGLPGFHPGTPASPAGAPMTPFIRPHQGTPAGPPPATPAAPFVSGNNAAGGRRLPEGARQQSTVDSMFE